MPHLGECMNLIKLLFFFVNLTFSCQSYAEIAPLITTDLKTWYEKETELAPGEFFGIYKIDVVGENVFLGLGTDRPASMDGAMLAKVSLSGGEAAKMAYLNEQGFIDMLVIGDQIHMPGADPGYPEFGWDAGNWYRINYVEETPKLELKRNLPFVVHGWGHWYDEKNNVIYHATSQVTCETPTVNGDCYQVPGAKGHGAIFKSNDLGDSWERIASLEDNIGSFRTYDIAGTEDALFAVWSDRTPEGSVCGLAIKKMTDKSWTRIKYADVNCVERLVTHGNRVLTLSNRGPFLLAVSDEYDSDSDPYMAIRLPAPKGRGGYNHIAVNPEELEIYFASNEGIYFTNNLKDWSLIEGTQDLTDVRDMKLLIEEKTLLVATPTQVYKISL